MTVSVSNNLNRPHAFRNSTTTLSTDTAGTKSNSTLTTTKPATNKKAVVVVGSTNAPTTTEREYIDDSRAQLNRSKSKIQSLEKTVEFLQNDHTLTLNGLHSEIKKLQDSYHDLSISRISLSVRESSTNKKETKRMSETEKGGVAGVINANNNETENEQIIVKEPLNILLNSQKQKYQEMVEKMKSDLKRKDNELENVKNELEMMRKVWIMAGLTWDPNAIQAITQSNKNHNSSGVALFIGQQQQQPSLAQKCVSEPIISVGQAPAPKGKILPPIERKDHSDEQHDEIKRVSSKSTLVTEGAALRLLVDRVTKAEEQQASLHQQASTMDGGIVGTKPDSRSGETHILELKSLVRDSGISIIESEGDLTYLTPPNSWSFNLTDVNDGMNSPPSVGSLPDPSAEVPISKKNEFGVVVGGGGAAAGGGGRNRPNPPALPPISNKLEPVPPPGAAKNKATTINRKIQGARKLRDQQWKEMTTRGV